MNQHLIQKRRIGGFSLILGTALAIWLGSPLQLADPTLNYNLSILLLLVGLLSSGLACYCLIGRKWLAIATALTFFLTAIVFTLLLMVSMIGGGPFVIYEKIDALNLPHSQLVAYRTNSGATIDYGVEIVQEMPLVPGIILTRHLHRADEAYQATLKLTDNGTVLVTVDGEAVEYELLDFLYR